jgi:hypothetical protein
METVFVYRNLTTNKWQYGPKAKSARTNTQTDELIVRNGSFKVLQGGYNFSAKNHSRTVHAFACGEIVKALPRGDFVKREISYNPFKANFFYFCDTKERVENCAFIHFAKDKKAYALIEA